MTKSVAKSRRVTEQCDVNIHSINFSGQSCRDSTKRDPPVHHPSSVWKLEKEGGMPALMSSTSFDSSSKLRVKDKFGQTSPKVTQHRNCRFIIAEIIRSYIDLLTSGLRTETAVVINA
ncbi:hypothetical protein TNCV_3073981 [Trichonephila clavipes]|nr:hypothetical protein TNCV_3073981 [Trichonephila clavipes]